MKLKMKYINKIILGVLALMAPLAACDTDTLQELNVNPQALNSVNTNFIFTGAQLQSDPVVFLVITVTLTGEPTWDIPCILCSILPLQALA